MQNRFASTGDGVGAASESPDDGNDTEPATDDEDDYAPTNSRKRKSKRSAGTGIGYADFISKALFAH